MVASTRLRPEAIARLCGSSLAMEAQEYERQLQLASASILARFETRT